MVMDSVAVHPFTSVKVIDTVPPAIPVTVPKLFTEAIKVLDDTQALIKLGIEVLDNIVVEPTQALNVPAIIGNALTVIVLVSSQPLTLVKVIIVVPLATAVTMPFESTVAIAGFEDTHGLTSAGVEMLANVVLRPSQIVNVPVMDAVAMTVKVSVLEHPLIPVKVIDATPTPTPVTTPLADTVAIKESDEIQGLMVAGAVVLDKRVVKPTQTFKDPVIVGSEVTVIDFVLVHPLLFVKVIVTVPAAIPVIIPAESMLAIAGSEEIQGLTIEGADVLENVVFSPTQTLNTPVIVGKS